jgi:hypothetical protein
MSEGGAGLRGMVDGSQLPPGAIEPVKKQGAPSTGSTGNPNSRQRRKSSPHSQGRVMEQPPTSPNFVGIDVSKDRLDVHVRPSGQTFAVTRGGKGLEQLTTQIRDLAPALIVLEATGGFEITVAAALAAPACHSRVGRWPVVMPISSHGIQVGYPVGLGVVMWDLCGTACKRLIWLR